MCALECVHAYTVAVFTTTKHSGRRKICTATSKGRGGRFGRGPRKNLTAVAEVSLSVGVCSAKILKEERK